ncbi:CAF17-like 4Fe-4S cluster assembly/insertion protein YgfZ [Radicibacter daui]|uniref:CAF17-like 4Fe-4S cluster assembly/insertion protein YgfZ n=1 Tax=Radicibacter daui TaxID=3064829 RepID=UPI004046AC5E
MTGSASGYLTLPARAVLALGGEDRVAFLQGLVSNDIAAVSPARAVQAALLTPQGKYLFDFAVASDGDRLLLDVEAARLDDLYRRLRMYKLRSKVTLEPLAGWSVTALAGPTAATLGAASEAGSAAPLAGGVLFTDPRIAGLGARLMAPAEASSAALTEAGIPAMDEATYETLRLTLGVPDGARDFELEKSTLLEGNMDAFNAISWEKGCYVGQELTARTRYRGLLKKRMMPVEIEGPLPAPGTQILQDGKDAGEVRSGAGNRAIAIIRLEALEKTGLPLMAGEARILPPAGTPQG